MPKYPDCKVIAGIFWTLQLMGITVVLDEYNHRGDKLINNKAAFVNKNLFLNCLPDEIKV